MGKKSGPKAPDPVATANAQSEANKEAILASALVNRYNEVTPYGSVEWLRPGSPNASPQTAGSQTAIPNFDGFPLNLSAQFGSKNSPAYSAPSGETTPEDLSGWTRVTSLSDSGQKQLDQKNQLAEALGAKASQTSDLIPQTRFTLNDVSQRGSYTAPGYERTPEEYGFVNKAQGDIANLYRSVLGREPDQAGLDFYRNELKSGRSLDDIRAAMERDKSADPGALADPRQLVGYEKTGGGEAVRTGGAGLPSLNYDGLTSLKSLDTTGFDDVRQFNIDGLQDVGRFDVNGLPAMQGWSRDSLGALPQYAGGGSVEGIQIDDLRNLDKDYSQDALRVEKATYDRLQNLMADSFSDRDRKLDNRLAVMGMPVGGEAYGIEKDRFGRLRNEADLNAALESVMAGRQEQSRLFGIDKAIHGQQLTDRIGKFSTDLSSADLASRNARDAYNAALAARSQATFETMAEADRNNEMRRQGITERLIGLDQDKYLREQGLSERQDMVDNDRASRAQQLAEALAGISTADRMRAVEKSEVENVLDDSYRQREQLDSEALRQFNADNQIRQQEINEKLLERSQPINELAALLQGSPAIPVPQSQNPAQYQVAPPDIAGLIQNQYNTKAANAASKKGGTTDLVGALGSAAILSDNRLKDNIQAISQVDGHTIYKWDWNDKASQFGLEGSASGVIAQEVEEYAPWFVVQRNGYKAVNYNGLFGGGS